MTTPNKENVLSDSIMKKSYEDKSNIAGIKSIQATSHEVIARLK